MLPVSDMHVATIENTPFVMQPKTLVGIALTLAASYVAARLHRPRWPRPAQWVLALVWFVAWECADTIHTVGHIRSARAVGARVDRVLLMWGLQSTRYDRADVTPRQHSARAIGGPLMSGTLTMTAMPLYTVFGRIPIVGAVIESWLICNALIFTGSLLPIPLFDGGSILKWATTMRTGEEALGDEAVQQAGSLTIAGLGLAALIFGARGKWRLAAGTAAAAMGAAADLFVLRGRLP